MGKRISMGIGLCLLYCAAWGQVSLDEAIRIAARDIERKLPFGVKAAVINFRSEQEAVSDYVIEELAIALVNGEKLVVVDRRDIDLIRKEMQFQFSGDVSDESAQRIGAMLGAQTIITGSLADMGGNYRFRVNAINVETAVRESATSIIINGRDETLVFFLTGERRGSQPAPQATAGSAPPAPAVPIPSGLEWKIHGYGVTVTKYTGNASAVVIPDYIQNLPVTAIGEKAFSGCAGLTEVHIPATVTTIGYAVFSWCGNLAGVTIPVSVQFIGDYAFFGCTALRRVSLSRRTAIGNDAFPRETQLSYTD